MSNVEVTGLELNVTANSGNSVEKLKDIADALNKLDGRKIDSIVKGFQNLNNLKMGTEITKLNSGLVNFTTTLKNMDMKAFTSDVKSLNKALKPLADTLDKIGRGNLAINYGSLSKGLAALNKAPATSKAVTASTGGVVRRTGAEGAVSATPLETAAANAAIEVRQRMENAITQAMSTPLLPAQTQAGVAYAARNALNEKLNQVITMATAQFGGGRAMGSINTASANRMASVITGNMYKQIADSIANASTSPKLPAVATSTIAQIGKNLTETVAKIPAISSANIMRSTEAARAAQQAPDVSKWEKFKDVLNYDIGAAAKRAGEGINGAVEKVDSYETAIREAASQSKVLSAAYKGVAKAAEIAQKAIKAVAKGLATAGAAMASFARGPLSMVLNPFKGLATTIKNVSTRFSKFLSSLKRVAIYRAIRAALKAITQGMKEGIENLYYWSQLTNGDFAPAMDRIATAALYVKNSLAAMVSPIITYVAPAIDMLADKFVALLNVMNQFFARITGRGTWTEALKYPTQYAENTAGAAKKIKDNIQDFDELHILRTPNAGGSGDNLDYNNMFKESEFTNEFSDWIGEFKRALQSEQFYKAGTLLGEAVSNLFDKKIDWDGIGTKVGKRVTDVFQFALGFLRTFSFQNLGSNVATFLNNAIDAVDANAVGAVFAYKIQSIVDFAFGFVTTANWWGFGQKISDYVTGWFETIDGAKIGKTISTAIHGALTMVESFLEDDYKFNLIAEDIAGFINNVDWVGILTRTLKIGAKILEAIMRVIRRAITGESAEAPSEIFESTVQWRIDYETRRANGTLNTSMGGIGDTISSTVADSIEKADFMSVAEAFKDLLETAWDAAWELVKFAVEIPGTKIAEAVSDVYAGGHYNRQGEWVLPNDRSFGQTFARGSERLLFGGMFDTGNTMPRILNFLGQVASNTQFAAAGVGGLPISGTGRRRQGTPNANLLSQRYNKVPDYTSSAKSMLAYHEATKKQEYTLSELYKLSETSAANMATHWEDSAAKIESKVTGRFENTRLKIGATISDLTSDSTTKFDALGTAMSQSLDGVASAMVTPLNNIKGQITGAFAEAGQVTKDDIGNLSEVMTTSLKGVYDASAPEVEKVNSLWGSLHTNMKTTGNGIIDISEKVGNSIIDAFNAMGEGLKNYNGITFPDGRKIDLGSIKTVNHLSIPRLAEGGLVSSPTVAMVGEAGREAILPLDNNTAWMDALAERIGADGEEVALLREQNDLLRQIAAKKTGITTKEVFDAVRSENRDYFVSTGKNALVM